MSWWRNEDSCDDDNELEIKLILAIPLVIIISTGLVIMLFEGCAYEGQARDASYKIDCSKCEVQIEFIKSHKAKQFKKD